MERTKFQRHKEVISRLGIVFVLLGLILLWSCL